MSNKELEKYFLETIKSPDRVLEFVSHSLRGAKEIHKYGGHVTDKYRDQVFRMWFNNCRVILNPNNIDLSTEEVLLDSRPPVNIEESLTLRHYSKLPRTNRYQKNTSLKSTNIYKSYLEMAVRTFLKDLFNNNNGLSLSDFSGYKDIINFIEDFSKTSRLKIDRKIDKAYISQVKIRGFKVKVNKIVPKTTETLKFADYIESKYPNFNKAGFFKK